MTLKRTTTEFSWRSEIRVVVIPESGQNVH